MACSYYNKEKDNVWSGIYCDRMGGHPGNEYWRCYCDSNPSECPYLGGSDPYELHPDTVRKREERERREKMRREEDERRERERREEESREAARRNSGTGYQKKTDYGRGGSGGGKGGKGGSGGMRWTTKALLVLAAIAVVVGGIWFAGAKLGIIKSTVTMTTQVPEGSSIKLEEVSVRAIVQDGKYKETTAQFDENGQCKMKLRPGMNDVYIEYDGTSVFCDTYEANGFYHHTVDLDLSITEILMLRVLAIDFQNTKGETIYPNQIKVTDEKGEEIRCARVNQNSWSMVFGNNTTGGVYYFSVEGYKTLEVPLDLSARMSHMILTLEEA